MITIGLTGGIATGKSTVGDLLREKNIEVLSADKMAHQVMQCGEAAYYKIVEEFGREILLPDGSINRKILGERIFREPEARKKLEEMIHPEVITLIKQGIESCANRGVEIMVVETPLLYEAGLSELFDYIWVVSARPEIQLKRLVERNQFTETEAKRRISAQMPLEEKEQRADAVILNNEGLKELEEQICTLLRTLEWSY